MFCDRFKKDIKISFDKQGLWCKLRRISAGYGSFDTNA